MAGCGGCESCVGKPGDFDAEAPVTTATGVKPTAADAGVRSGDADAPLDGGKGAVLDAAATPRMPVEMASGVPRPKNAPMPVGAYQSCGIYEGPVCERECKNGNCRQECDGVECTLSCNGGYCSQLCGANAKCRFTCNGGHCVQSCAAREGCIKECAGGSCE